MGNCIINRVSNLSSIEQQITSMQSDITGINRNLSDLSSAITTKQDTLVSGTNIKTINSTSLLGSGDINLDSSYVKLDGSARMTDNLGINIPASATPDPEEPQSLTERYLAFYGTDSSTQPKTFLSSRITASGVVATRLSTRHSTSNTQEVLVITVNSAGTRTITFTTPEAWRAGLGLPEPMNESVEGEVKIEGTRVSGTLKCCKWGRTVMLYLDFTCSTQYNSLTTIARITTSTTNKFAPAFDFLTNVSPNAGTGNPYIKVTTGGVIQLGGYPGSDANGVRALITYLV